MVFLFSVLGSFIFWGFYLLGSLVIGVRTLAKDAPKTFKVIKENKNPDEIGVEDIFFILVYHLVLWFLPVLFKVGEILFIHIFKNIIWTFIRFVVLGVHKLTPDFDIIIKKNKGE